MSNNIVFNDLFILSIDIGTVNLALYKEKIDRDKLAKIQPVAFYQKDGRPTDRWNKELNSLYTCGEKVWMDKADITAEDDRKIGKKVKRRIVTCKMLNRLTNYLEKNKTTFDDLDEIIIELQLKTNPSAQEISHHIRAWFLITYKGEKPVYMFPSKFKTQVLGAPFTDKKKLTASQRKTIRKNWARETAHKILEKRNDMHTLNFIFNINKSKQDDLSDCICQLMAYLYLTYVKGNFNGD